MKSKILNKKIPHSFEGTLHLCYGDEISSTIKITFSKTPFEETEIIVKDGTASPIMALIQDVTCKTVFHPTMGYIKVCVKS